MRSLFECAVFFQLQTEHRTISKFSYFVSHLQPGHLHLSVPSKQWLMRLLLRIHRAPNGSQTHTQTHPHTVDWIAKVRKTKIILNAVRQFSAFTISVFFFSFSVRFCLCRTRCSLATIHTEGKVLLRAKKFQNIQVAVFLRNGRRWTTE